MIDDIDVVRMSSKGQIVIPKDMREDLHEGDKLVVIKRGGQLILRKSTKMDEKLLEDLEFARRTEEAHREIEAGNYVEMDSKEFLKELGTW